MDIIDPAVARARYVAGEFGGRCVRDNVWRRLPHRRLSEPAYAGSCQGMRKRQAKRIISRERLLRAPVFVFVRRDRSGPNSIRALHCERECTQHEGIRKIVI